MTKTTATVASDYEEAMKVLNTLILYASGDDPNAIDNFDVNSFPSQDISTGKKCTAVVAWPRGKQPDQSNMICVVYKGPKP